MHICTNFLYTAGARVDWKKLCTTTLQCPLLDNSTKNIVA